MKSIFKFGKVAYYGTRKENAVEIEVELRQRGGEPTFTINRKTGERTPTGHTTPIYTELSICGSIWNRIHTDIITGGQCLDTIAQYIKNNPVFDKLYEYWKRYHLNGMHAGTPEQEAAIEAWKANGNRYEYKAACEELKRLGLYTVNYTGLSVSRRYDNEPYTYGHGWIIQQIPGDVLTYLEHLIDTNNATQETRT